MHLPRYGATFESSNSKQLFEELFLTNLFNSKRAPDKIKVDGVEINSGNVKLKDFVLRSKEKIVLLWDEEVIDVNLVWDSDGTSSFRVTDFELSVDETLLMLSRLRDWEIAVFGMVHREWVKKFNYHATGFGSPLSGSLGWACAFKGDGHNRVVSRRFLEHGPWRTIRDEAHDITLIQFHDLEADAATALEQARDGHDFLAAPLQGGFYQKNLRLKSTEFSGVYDPNEKKQLMLIPAHDVVTRAQMMDACKIKHFQLLGEDKPLENVAFVFFGGEAEAQPYLPEMWMRELEVYAIDKGVERRLDLDYVPNIEKPDWVKQLENA
jgi:hypothetical protein